MSDKTLSFPGFPRAVRPVPDPLGLYFRAGRNDQVDLLNLIAAGDASCFGIVFDPTLVTSQKELRDQILANRLDAILDPRTQPAAMPGGYTDALGKLPWGGNMMHTPANFTGTLGRRPKDTGRARHPDVIAGTVPLAGHRSINTKKQAQVRPWK